MPSSSPQRAAVNCAHQRRLCRCPAVTRTGAQRLTERVPSAWWCAQEHPVYTTSNNIYGSKLPVQPQMPNSYHGLNGRFTNAFAGPYKAASLNVGKTRSKVHGELDEF